MKTKAIYYDTETTGTRPGKDRIIEIAAFCVTEEKTFCTFINPECPIPPESSAICTLSLFTDFCPSGSILIAHNNDSFDKPMLEFEFQRAGLKMPEWIFIDTLKWARKYRPDLPRHTLQFLREAYEIPPNQAHRALDDCIILHQLFQQMIDDLSWDQVLQLLSQTSKITRMPFGKHAGKLLAEVPKNYVSWLAGSGALDKPENGQLRKTFETLGLLT